MPRLKIRDWDYIDNRLLAPVNDALDAAERLREVGRGDLAERVMVAAQVFQDECRRVRHRLHDDQVREMQR